MAAKKPLPEFFLSLMRELALDQDEDFATERWRRLSRAMKLIGESNLEGLLRCALGSKHRPRPDEIAAFAKKVLPVDAEPKEHERELQLLAVAALALLMEEGSDRSLAAALRLTTSFVDRRAPQAEVKINLAARAAGALSNARERRVGNPEVKPLSVDQFDFSEVITPLETNVAPAECAQALAELGRAINENAAEHGSAVNTALRQLGVQLDSLRDEADTLWWLVSSYSECLDRPFGEIAEGDRAMVLGFELSQLTRAPPGPSSLKALFARAGVPTKRQTIVDAVNSLPAEVRDAAALVENPSPVSAPIHYAIVRQRDAGDAESWIAGWAAATELSNEHEMPGRELAQQFYYERLSAR